MSYKRVAGHAANSLIPVLKNVCRPRLNAVAENLIYNQIKAGN